MPEAAYRKLELPQLAWFGAKERQFDLPDYWEVTVCKMAGAGRPALSAAEIARAVAAPLVCPPLRELARGRKEVAILFDDLTRVTPAHRIVPFVLQELAAAGVPDDGIRFIAALGCHGALNRQDFAKKLGAEVVERYPVYNHNPFANCVEVGSTGSGLRLEVNAEAMACDLRIGIGAVTPHAMTGFGGGGKIILPGISSLRTAAAFHRREGELRRGGPGRWMGITEGNPLSIEIVEAARLARLDFKVDCLVNGRGEIVAVYAGEPATAYAVAVADARAHYRTPKGEGYDLVIANTFAKANEVITGLPAAFCSLRKGGEVILIGNAPDGQAVHYLMGTFGKSAFGELRLQASLPSWVRRLIVFSEYPDPAGKGYFAADERVLFLSRWEEVLEAVADRWGKGTRVGVLPSADIQYCD